jgi:hypothetical protein
VALAGALEGKQTVQRSPVMHKQRTLYYLSVHILNLAKFGTHL